jgi:hypothetical protein
MSPKRETNPYAPPKAQEPPPSAQLPASSGNIELRLRAPIPRLCLKCGVTEPLVERHQLFSWEPGRRSRGPMFWFALLGPLAAAIASMRTDPEKRTASFHLPLCPRCNARWRTGKLLSIGAYVALFLVLVVARQLLEPGVVIVLLALSIAGIYFARKEDQRRSLSALYISDDTALLGGASPLVVKRLGELLALMPKKAKRKRAPAPVEAEAQGDPTHDVESALRMERTRPRREARRHPRSANGLREGEQHE